MRTEGSSEPAQVRLPNPTLADVLAARERIKPYLQPTALYPYPVLTELVGTEVWVKHENHQPVGAFKVRGGINLVAQLSTDERSRGLITASTGNHGQSIAYAARLFGVKAIVCVPEQPNPVKVAAIRALGAEIIQHGHDFDEATFDATPDKLFAYMSAGGHPHAAFKSHRLVGVADGVVTVKAEVFNPDGSTFETTIWHRLDPPNGIETAESGGPFDGARFVHTYTQVAVR